MLKQAIFERIHTGSLIYNTCWEDPRCDRALLRLTPESRVVMLTSAGCNALDYLLDGPASIACVDMNPRQNALLELKKAFFRSASHGELAAFFGEGWHPQAREVFHDALHPALSGFPADYWQRQIGVFSGRGLRKSFYYHGSAGVVAFFVKKFLESQPGTRRLVHQLFECADLDTQRELYLRLEPRLLNRLLTWLLDRHLVQSMLGVPASQQALARATFRDGMAGYFRACFRRVFMEQPVGDNYFWKLYFFGRYSADCCPNYLRRENNDLLRQHIHRISTHTDTLTGFLRRNPGQYTHFVLLDHQDWLAAHDRPALAEEWRLILENSAPGAKILPRSAAPQADFVPGFVRERLRFDTENTAREHLRDRVGTYASVHLALA